MSGLAQISDLLDGIEGENAAAGILNELIMALQALRRVRELWESAGHDVIRHPAQEMDDNLRQGLRELYTHRQAVVEIEAQVENLWREFRNFR